MPTPERDRIEHFRQRWADEDHNGSIINPSSSSAASTGDHSSPKAPSSWRIKPTKPSTPIYKPPRISSYSWRERFGLASRSEERLAENTTCKRHTFQPRNADEDTALPTMPDHDTNESNLLTDDHSKWAFEIYTASWLIFFSLLGTLSRLGVEAITQYPNATVTSRVLWANIGGSFIMGFLMEDKSLFKQTPSVYRKELPQNEQVAEYNRWKKKIPLFVGLSTGYCGSFTSFSTFIRDAFLELANEAGSPSQTRPYRPVSSIAHRGAGFSVEALIAILILHPALSIAALYTGSQFALLTAPVLPNVNRGFLHRILNPLVVLLSIGCWLVACVVLSVVPPYNDIYWRTRGLFPLLFAPIGCLLRYYLSKCLNPINSKFPWGTFTSNIFGTIILGLCWDLQHTDLEGLGVRSATACALLAGVQEGFCGCLTTVSTWVVELTSLSRKHGWIYGIASVAVGFASLVIIMGSMRWTVGFNTPACG